MIVQPDDKLFDQLFWYLYTTRGDETAENFSCEIFSAILAYQFSLIKKHIYIIESLNHTVVYDGQSTWDLHLGIVFKDYKYPSLNVPKYIKIPKFCQQLSDKFYNSFYSRKNLSRDRQQITVKVISNL